MPAATAGDIRGIRFNYVLAELGHLVEEEHAPMRQADLTGPRPPWPDQPSGQAMLPAAD